MIPVTPEEFYRIRDDRTLRSARSWDYRVSILITIADDLARNPTGMIMMSVCCALAARWCRDVVVCAPTLARLDAEALLMRMRLADPYGRFRVVQSCERTDLHLHLGSGMCPASDRAVGVSAGSWRAGLSYGSNPPLAAGEEVRAVGAIAAACLGVAQLFKFAIGLPRDLWLTEGEIDLSRLARQPLGSDPAHGSVHEEPNLGHVLMVGAGSVGSSALYCAQLVGLRGHVTVVDFDRAKLENVPRSLLFDCLSVGRRKVDVLAERTLGTGLAIRPVPSSWNEFVSAGGLSDGGFDSWLPLANEENVRWSMQNNMPPVMVQASTSQNWGVNFGRHLPGIDDCLACRFPNPEDGEGLMCSGGAIAVDDDTVDASLPFLSLFAGLLVVCELIRMRHPDPMRPNYAFFDFGGRLSEIQAWKRSCRPGCRFAAEAPGAAKLGAST